MSTTELAAAPDAEFVPPSDEVEVTKEANGTAAKETAKTAEARDKRKAE